MFNARIGRLREDLVDFGARRLFLIVLLYSFLAFLHSGSLRDIEYPPFFAGYAIIFILIAIIWEFPGSTRVSDEIMRAIFALDFFSGLFYLAYWKFVVCL